jgi:hypothetical protein
VTTPRLTDEQIDLLAWAVENTGYVRFSDQRETLEALIAEVRALRSASPVAQGEPRADLAEIERLVHAAIGSATTAALADAGPSAGYAAETDEAAKDAERRLLSALHSLVRRAEAAEGWQLAVADGLGYVNRAEGQGGYEVAEPSVVLASYRAAIRALSLPSPSPSREARCEYRSRQCIKVAGHDGLHVFEDRSALGETP